MWVQDVPVGLLSFDRFRSVIGAEGLAELQSMAAGGAELLAGRAVWSINSTARGGGVAEMLGSLTAYARGAGVDARWAVIEGDPEFFAITKRVHNLLHASPGDGGPLADAERRHYEHVLERCSAELLERVRPGDIVLLHDPQTLGLVAALEAHGAHVVWRCHVGVDEPDEHTARAREFLAPYLDGVEAVVFSRREHRWAGMGRGVTIIPPSIDAFAVKNEELSPSIVASILARAGIVAGVGRRPLFARADGSPARVDREARVVGGPLPPGVPVVAQVSRWDALKDPVGVIDGFVAGIAPLHPESHLLLAGPDVQAVDDDPEGAAVLADCVARREHLDPDVARRVHLAALPMVDLDENAAIVNAIQRHATVVVQKSIAEGFGLTVSEAMWKGRPVVAGAVGGINDQIDDGVSGLLVDPLDLGAYADAVNRLLADPELAARIAEGGRRRVRSRYLGPRHLVQYLQLFRRLVASEQGERAA